LKAFLSEQGKHNLTAPAEPTWTAHDIDGALARVAQHPVGDSRRRAELERPTRK